MNHKVFINQVYIENFKTVEKAKISFEDEGITVLDGPNGFGKTTIFDSIELVLTGQISRIQKYKIAMNSRGYKDYLFAKDQSKPVIIKIVLKCMDEERTIYRTFARRVIPSALKPTGKKPFEFNYELHEVTNLEQDLDNTTLTTEEKLKSIFDVSDFRERYGLYHYVEQEDSSFFLKKNEKERMDVISKLFSIQQEIAEKVKLESARTSLRSEKRNIVKQIDNIKDFSENKEQENFQIEDVPYNRLLPHTTNKLWDKENIDSLDKEKRSTYLLELNQIKLFKEHFEDFKKQGKNQLIKQIATNTERISGLIVLGHFHKDYQKLKLEFEQKHQLINYLKIIEEKEIISKYVDWDLIYKLFDLPIEMKGLLDRIETIKAMDNLSDKFSGILKTLLLTRENLKTQFNLIVNHNHNDEIGRYCPYCGNDWETFSKLNAELDKKTNSLKQELDESSSKVIFEMDELYKVGLQDVIDKIQSHLASEKIISDEFFKQLEKYNKLEIDFEKGLATIEKFGINLNELINNEQKMVTDLEERTRKVIQAIELQKELTSQLTIDSFSTFQQIFVDVFQREESVINDLKIEDIELKKQYIDQQYHKQSSMYFKKVKELNEKLSKIDSYCNHLDAIITVYNNKINEHRGNMINDLEIPFYIYSGKVIQNHQRGIGVFIKEGGNEENTELKAINFVPPEETDHDIVHSFSSGQLSATVLSFTLALNKVYNQSGLNAILIDDPVQTMDEINMASFVELIRNDFSDKQIILSTHEDNISLYMRYKFAKFGLHATNFNVKEKFNA